MQSSRSILVAVFLSVFILTGCVVRTYQQTRDRADQNLSGGNRGYLKGSAPASESVKSTKKTRTSRNVEFEMHWPIKIENAQQQADIPKDITQRPIQEERSAGNRGFMMPLTATPTVAAGADFQAYTVQKLDTLQKISEKFYGTTKKWTVIYEANKDVLKAPNKIYPGQTIKIPRK